MVRVLIADDDLDSHELLDDLIEINFRDVEIDRALTTESFLQKTGAADASYDLVLFNMHPGKSGSDSEAMELVSHLEKNRPQLLERTVFILPKDADPRALGIADRFPVLLRPFSLDEFSDVVQKANVF